MESFVFSQRSPTYDHAYYHDLSQYGVCQHSAPSTASMTHPTTEPKIKPLFADRGSTLCAALRAVRVAAAKRADEVAASNATAFAEGHPLGTNPSAPNPAPDAMSSTTGSASTPNTTARHAAHLLRPAAKPLHPNTHALGRTRAAAGNAACPPCAADATESPTPSDTDAQTATHSSTWCAPSKDQC